MPDLWRADPHLVCLVPGLYPGARRRMTGKTSRKTSRRKPKHGKGELNNGNPGNKGGTGRPSDLIREQCQGSFAERIPVLEQIADGQAIQKVKLNGKETDTLVSPDVGDRIKAIDLLGKYAGLQKIELAGSLGISKVLDDLDHSPDDPE